MLYTHIHTHCSLTCSIWLWIWLTLYSKTYIYPIRSKELLFSHIWSMYIVEGVHQIFTKNDLNTPKMTLTLKSPLNSEKVKMFFLIYFWTSLPESVSVFFQQTPIKCFLQNFKNPIRLNITRFPKIMSGVFLPAMVQNGHRIFCQKKFVISCSSYTNLPLRMLNSILCRFIQSRWSALRIGEVLGLGS